MAVKTISWFTTSGEGGMHEIATFEYGGMVITVYQQSRVSNVLQLGWNRVKNVNDNDLNSVIS